MERDWQSVCDSFSARQNVLRITYGPWTGLTAYLKDYLNRNFKDCLRGVSYVFPLYFTVLLKHLRRLYGYSSIFKCCQCIITVTAPATLAALTPDYEVLTNQGDALVSVYIDSVALQLNLSHYSNEHKILYVLRALNTTPLCHLSDTNNIIYIKYSGFIINIKSIKIDLKKISAINS